MLSGFAIWARSWQWAFGKPKSKGASLTRWVRRTMAFVSTHLLEPMDRRTTDASFWQGVYSVGCGEPGFLLGPSVHILTIGSPDIMFYGLQVGIEPRGATSVPRSWHHESQFVRQSALDPQRESCQMFGRLLQVAMVKSNIDAGVCEDPIQQCIQFCVFFCRSIFDHACESMMGSN